MTTKKKNTLSTPGDVFAVMDDDQLACRGQEHAWSRFHPRKKVPRGARFLTNPDGSIQITETCASCKKTRTITTMPGGWLDENARYDYDKPEHWITIPRGLMPRRALKSELYRRMLEAGAAQ